MIKILIYCIYFLQIAPSFPVANISGFWSGKITQDVAVYKSDYKFEMIIKQKGKKITGRTYVYSDNYFAVMSMEGEYHNNILSFKELKIIDNKDISDMEWCIKSGVLKVVNKNGIITLEGPWIGKSSQGNCNPGKIILSKGNIRV